MKSKRPININPLSIKLPMPAWVSITHRLSGLALFFLIPLCLWMLSRSLSPAGFNALQTLFASFWMKAIIFILVASLIFHLLAGLRHLLMDMHLGDSLKAGRFSAWLVMILSAVLIFGSIYWVWG